MATILSETATYLSTVTVPANGDPRTVTSVNVAFATLANRTKYLRERILALDSDVDGEVEAPLRPPAGTTTVAPLKLTSGTNLTTPENGAVEYDGTDVTITTGGTRKAIATEDQLHDQNTDTGTDAETFTIDDNQFYPDIKWISSKVTTESTGWEDIATFSLARYHAITFDLLVAVHDTAMANNHVGAFRISGAIKRGELAASVAFVESTPSATKIASDNITGTYFEVQAIADTTNGALVIQGKALTNEDTIWGVTGHTIETLTAGA